MITTRPPTPLEREKLKRAFEQWDKPLSPPKPVPKSIPKKRGRPAKDE